MTTTGLGQVGEAFIALRYRMDTLEQDLRKVDTVVNRQVNRIGQTTGGAFTSLSGRIGAPFEQLQARMGVFASGLGALKAGLIGLFAGAAISSVKRFADEIAAAGVQLQLVQQRVGTLSGERDFFDRLAISANRLGLSVSDAADSAQRFLIARKELGLTTNEVIKLNEVIVNLGRLGGSSQAELAAGAQQLAQALARGQLSGDELTSVLENLPLVAKTIADGLGVGVGQLKKLGSEGKISGRDVAQALLAAFGQVNAQIGQLPETLEQSSARFETAWTAILARLDQLLQLSTLKKNITALSAALLESFNVKVLGGGDLGAQMRVAERDAASLREELVKLNAEKDRLSKLDPVEVAAAKAQGVELSVDTSQIDALIASRKSELQGITRFLKEQREEAAALSYGRQQETDKANAGRPQAPSKEDEKAGKDAAKLADRQQDAVNTAKLAAEAQARLVAAYAESEAAVKATTLALEAEATARAAGIALGTAQYDQLLKEITARDASEAAVEKAQETRKAEADLVKRIAEAERDLAEQRAEAAGVGTATAERDLAVRTAELELTERGIAANTALGARYIEVARQAGALRDATAANEAAVDAYNDKVDEATAKGDQFGDVFANAAEEAIFAFDNLGEAVASLIEDLARLIVRMTVLEPLARSISAAFAGAFSPAAPAAAGGAAQPSLTSLGGGYAQGAAFANGRELMAFAKGGAFGGHGIVRKPTLFPMARGAGLMGEAGPEGVLPLARTSDGSLGVKTDGSSGGGGGDVVINVIDQRSSGAPPVERRESQGPDGTQMIELIIREVGTRIERGAFDNPLGNRFGVRPGLSAT